MVDRISNLPDELLCHILSFLPTDFAFRTTVLAKRWTSLFYSLPVLNFDISTSTDHQNVDQFCRFVNNIMLSPLSTNQPLKKFSLFLKQKVSLKQMESSSSILNFNGWLEAATRRCVEELHVILATVNIIQINHCRTLKSTIFISEVLVVVKLEFLKIGTDTSSVHLPSLKTLHLRYVYFTDQDDYINFLSACPNVDDLEVQYIFHKQKKHEKKYPYNAPEGFKSLTFSKLVKASIGSIYAYPYNKFTELIVCPTNAMFNGICNVQFLRLNIQTKASFKFKVIPVFSNFIHIKLVFYFVSSYYWGEVVELLRHCPKLQILFIEKVGYIRESTEWKYPTPVLECVSSHLNSCTILNLDDITNDLRFATYILQNASLLQDMTINVAKNYSLKHQIIKELSSCPRISPECKLSFV